MILIGIVRQVIEPDLFNKFNINKEYKKLNRTILCIGSTQRPSTANCLDDFLFPLFRKYLYTWVVVWKGKPRTFFVGEAIRLKIRPLWLKTTDYESKREA